MGVPVLPRRRRQRCPCIAAAALLRVLFSLFCCCCRCATASLADAELAVLVDAPPTALERNGFVSSRVDISYNTTKRDHLDLRLLYPEQGGSTPSTTLFRCHVRRQFELLTETETLYYLQPSTCRVCVQLDGQIHSKLCMKPALHELDHAGVMQELIAPVRALPTGNHSAHCLVVCGDDTTRITSDSVSFTVVSGENWTASRAWKRRAVGVQNNNLLTLIIGVKTSTRWGFPLRQAIRETWASPSSLPPGVRVVFLGCRAPPDATDNAFTYGIELEQRDHDDLLVDELGACEDSYDGLVGKVTAFVRYVATHYTKSRPTVMTTDDDVYLDVYSLLQYQHSHLPSNQECVYAGQVWEEQFNLPVEPVRDPTNRYFVSEQAYPAKYWPPFAFGPHYLLSWECLGLIMDNQRLISGFRGLDDVSIAVWLLASGVCPRHVPHFKNLRNSVCLQSDNGIISLADLSTTALYAIHDNLQAGRAFCHRSDLSAWLRWPEFIPSNTLLVVIYFEVPANGRDVELTRQPWRCCRPLDATRTRVGRRPSRRSVTRAASSHTTRRIDALRSRA